METVFINDKPFQVPAEVAGWMRQAGKICTSVKRMRDVQQRYFDSRDRSLIPACKAIEHEVDKLLQGKEPAPANLQGGLF